MHGLPIRAAARVDAVGAAGLIEQRRLTGGPFVRQEVRPLTERVVLRLLADEADADVQRELVVHLPVVLDVGLGVVRDVPAFHEPGELLVRVEDAERRIREPVLRVERVVGVVRQVQRAWSAAAAVLGFVTVVVVEADLQRVAPGDLGHARLNVLGQVVVEPARIRQVGRAVATRLPQLNVGGNRIVPF